MKLSRNTRIGIAAVAVATLPITALSLQPTNAASGSSAAQTFRLVERGGTFRFVDLPPKQQAEDDPVTAGDEFVFTSKLFRAGKRVGTLHAQCTFTRRSANFGALPAVCVGTFALRGGSLQVQTGGLLKETIELAITGGTGKYAGATGTVTSRNSGARSVDIVRLLS